MRRGLATAAALTLTLLLAPTAQAAYEQTGVFAGSATPLTKEQIEANEEVQLGGVGGMAVNYTGAGGVPAGTVYAATRGSSNGTVRIAVYTPTAGGGLEFSLGWLVTTTEEPYERCGPDLEPTPTVCPTRVSATPGKIDVDVDQSTGNVYAYNGTFLKGDKTIVAYTPEGDEVLSRFGELTSSTGKTTETPEKIHRFPSYVGGLAVNDSGEVYVFDIDGADFTRLMKFRPTVPGQYDAYEYAGTAEDVGGTFIGAGNPPTKPVADAAGNLYVSNAEETVVEKYDLAVSKTTPVCSFTPAKGGVTAIGVNPETGTPFFFSYKTPKRLFQLGPCDPKTGQFTGGIIGETVVSPERDDLYGLAFDPVRKLAGRPAGVLYAGAPAPVSSNGVGKGQPGQSSLGYVFAQSAVPQKALTVTKVGSGTGKVTSSPSGIDCGSACTAEFGAGEAVTLTAKADAGSEFKGWSGSGCSGTGTCIVTMSEAISVTAEFTTVAKPQFLLKAEKEGTGTGTVTSSPPGIDCGSDCEEQYEEGTAVTLTGTPGANTKAATWTGCDSVDGENKCLVSMSAAKEVTASFEAEAEEPGIPLTVALEGAGSGTVASDKGAISCTPFCTDEYEAATVVVLTATPTQGSTFYSWRYCDKGGVNGRQCTVSVDKAKTVKATFTITHALEVSKAPGSGLGKVQSSPGGVLCLANCSETSAAFKEGTEVTLKPTPAKHFHFVEWGGDCSGAFTCQVTMGEAHDVSAQFAEDPKHLLTLTKSGGGAGTVKSSVAGINCGVVCSTMSSAYYQGEVVELTATSGKGSAFKGWSGAGCSGTGTCSVTISEAKGVTAEFG